MRGAEGLDKLSLISINKEGLVSVLHALFQVGESAYKDSPGEIFAIRGEISTDGLPAIVRLKTIKFAVNFSFVGTPILEFEIHLAGLNYNLPRDFKDSTHQLAVEDEDNGVRLVKSCGLAFFPCTTT